MEDVEMYYDKMSDEYEHVVRSWGYNLPETVIESLITHGHLTKHPKFSMLDLGCGDGLCGMDLKVDLLFMISFGVNILFNFNYINSRDTVKGSPHSY